MISKDLRKGAQHFEKLKDALLKNIEETFNREPESLQPNSQPDQIKMGEKGKVVPEYEGWKSLETSMRIL